MKSTEKAKDKISVSDRKSDLAADTTTHLQSAIGRDISEPLKEAFTKLFLTMQSKTLERLQGLLTGVESSNPVE